MTLVERLRDGYQMATERREAADEIERLMAIEEAAQNVEHAYLNVHSIPLIQKYVLALRDALTRR